MHWSENYIINIYIYTYIYIYTHTHMYISMSINSLGSHKVGEDCGRNVIILLFRFLLWTARSTRTVAPRTQLSQGNVANSTRAPISTSHEPLQFAVALRPVTNAHPSGTPQAFLRSRPTVSHFSKQQTSALLSAATNTVRENPVTDATTGLWHFCRNTQLLYDYKDC